MKTLQLSNEQIVIILSALSAVQPISGNETLSALIFEIEAKTGECESEILSQEFSENASAAQGM